MAIIQTVTGPVDTSALGRVFSHEHVFVHDEGVLDAYPYLWGRDRAISMAREKLTALYERGVSTILEHSILGCGRRIRDIAAVAEGLPIHIVAATGLYYFDRLPGIFQDEDTIVDCLVRDITQGMEGTGIKAAVIKCATDRPGVTPGVEMALRAAARAHRETGAVLSTHAHAGSRQGLAQLEVFAKAGVDLTKVYIGHVMDSDQLDYHLALLDQGCFIGFDRFAAGPPPPGIPYVDKATAVGVLAELIRRGYLDQLLLGNDGSCYQTVVRFGSEAASPSIGNNDFTDFFDNIIPLMHQAGITDGQIDHMLIDNPRRLLERNLAP